jgi:hypothetical protein
MSKKLLGAEHPDNLMSISNLASTYRTEAEQLQVQVMDMSKKLFGAEYLDTLMSIANLASTYWSQRRWNEAEQLEIQVMDMRKRLLGAEHPDTLKSIANLASTLAYRNQGSWNVSKYIRNGLPGTVLVAGVHCY